MKTKTISFENISPIDGELIISMLKVLKEKSGSTDLGEFQDRLYISESRTERLVNKGVKLGFLSFKILFEKVGNIDFTKKIVTLTEAGEKLIEDHQP